jgi:malonyl-CoA decarboxylase
LPADEDTGRKAFLSRTFGGFRRAWAGAASTLRRDGVLSTPKPELSDADARKLRIQINECLEGKGGEVSARNRAVALGELYLQLNADGQHRFLEMLAREYDIDQDAVTRRTAELQAIDFESDKEGFYRASHALREALIPQRVKLLTQFNGLALGVKFLVDMREDLLSIPQRGGALKALDRDIRSLFIQWFDVGFLEFKRITWDTPASILEKLMAYEAVHAIRSWDDLKHRLDSDRRCYAFFHPSMPEEPLIFVQIALVKGLAENIHDLIDERPPQLALDEADTAIFYSISNCQRGLAGVSFGNFLIKQVAADLKRDIPSLKQFATLSPIPGFVAWLRKQAESPEEACEPTMRAFSEAMGLSPQTAVEQLAEGEWLQSESLPEAIGHPLKQLAARFLTGNDARGRALDRVAHFHLTNGANVERLNWLGDQSNRGLRQAGTMMVNYRYDLARVDKNHEAYRGHGEIVRASEIDKLLKG